MQAARQTRTQSLNRQAVPKKTVDRKVRGGEHQPVRLTFEDTPGQLGFAAGILPQLGRGPATGLPCCLKSATT